MAMKVKDLRHELASRDLPTEGLKQDLAFRLASLDELHGSLPLTLPHPIRDSLSETIDGAGTLAKTKDDDKPTIEFEEKSSEQISPPRVDSSLLSAYDHHYSDKDRRVSSLARISITVHVAFLSILLIIWLSYILWHYLPAADKEFLSRSIENGHGFVVLNVNSCQDAMRSQLQHGYQSINKKIQILGTFMQRVRSSTYPPRT